MIRILTTEVPEFRQVLEDSFLDRRDTTLETAESAQQLVRYAGRNLPSLVIADTMVPGGNGFEICRQLRTNLADDAPPVWIIGNEADRIPAQQAGAAGVLLRPLRREQILESIGRALPTLVRAAPRRPARLKVDLFHGDDERVGYTLDVSTRGAGIRVPGPIATPARSCG